MSARHRAPSIASLACSRYAVRPPAPIRSREAGVGGEPAKCGGERVRVARRNEKRALAVDEQLARGGGVRGHDGRAARERLKDLVRDHALRLGGRPEDPERAARVVQLVRQALVVDPCAALDVCGRVPHQRLELAAAHDAKAKLGCTSRGLEDRLQPVERYQLADEQRSEVLRCPPPRREDAFLCADEADLHVPRAELAKERAVRLRVRDDEIGGTKRCAVDRPQHARSRRPRREAGTVLHERVCERDERVEHDGPPVRGAFRRREVEVSRVADDERVEVGARTPEQRQLGAREPQRRAGTRLELVLLAPPTPTRAARAPRRPPCAGTR